MRKILLAVALAVALVMPMAPAKAVAPVIVLGAAAPMTVLQNAGIFAPTILFALGAENVDWATPIFGKDHVFHEASDYPAGANHVFVQTQKVTYVTGHVDDFDHPVMRNGVLSSN